MNSHPILFSTPMVEAILSGRKKQTRRVLKPQPQPSKLYKNAWNIEYKNHAAFNVSIEDLNTEFLGVLNHCPFGKIGDILWVRETYYAFGKWIRDHDYDTNKLSWRFEDETIIFESEYLYATNPPSIFDLKKNPGKLGQSTDRGYYKRPCIFMPKEACRIFLEITSIRVERLEDISHDDSISEGIERIPTVHWWKNYLNRPLPGVNSPRESFISLWKSINGNDSWESNPWVWVIEFKRIEKPENFLS